MVSPRIFADFHNADAQGRVRLNCAGTIDDLKKNHVTLAPRLGIRLYSEELEVDATVAFNEAEKVWVAVIDWDALTRSSHTTSVNGSATTVSDQPTTSSK